MKRGKYPISSLIAIVLTLVFFIPGRKTASGITGIEENVYMRYYYGLFNQSKDGGKKPVYDPIILFSIHNYHNRQDLSRVLEKIYDCNPAVIGIDVFFSNNPDIDEDINDELIRVMKKIQNKVVLPCSYTPDSLRTIYPFFYSVEGLQSITYASPISHDFFGHYEIDDSYLEKIDKDDVLRSMDLVIAEKSGYPLESYKDDFYINYVIKNIIEKYDTTQITVDDFENQIVIVGDLGDIRDVQQMPFYFGGRNKIIGVEDITYSVICWLKSSTNELDAKMAGTGFQKYPSYLSWLCAAIFALLYAFVDDLLKKRIIQKANRVKRITLIILKPILLIVIELLIVLFFYIVTFITNYIPDFFVSMIAVVMAGIANDISNVLIREKK